MPPPSLSSSTIVSFRPRRLRGQQAADVVRERDVADQQHDRAVAGGGRAEGAGDGAVDAVGAAVAQHARRVRRGPARTSRCRAPASRRRRTASPRRQQHAELGRDRRLGQAVVAEHAERSPRRPARRRCASARASPARPAHGARSPARAAPPRARARASPTSAAVGVLPGALGVERDLAARRAGPASHVAQRLGRRQVADAQHEIGREHAAKRGVAQQRVVVGDRRRAAPRARQRVGQQRPAGRLGERRRGLAASARCRRSSRPATTTPRRARATSSRERRVAAAPARGRRRAAHVRRAAGRGRSVVGGSGSSVTSGSRSGKFRCTAPGRPSSAVQ